MCQSDTYPPTASLGTRAQKKMYSLVGRDCYKIVLKQKSLFPFFLLASQWLSKQCVSFLSLFLPALPFSQSLWKNWPRVLQVENNCGSWFITTEGMLPTLCYMCSRFSTRDRKQPLNTSFNLAVSSMASEKGQQAHTNSSSNHTSLEQWGSTNSNISPTHLFLCYSESDGSWFVIPPFPAP